MRRWRARGLAVLVVLASIVSAAWGQLAVTPEPTSSHPMPLSTAGVVLTALRNNGASSVHISTVTGSSALACMGMTVHAVGRPVGSWDITIPAGGVLQIQIDTNGFADTMTHTCTFDVMDGAATLVTFHATFNPSTMPAKVELTPSSHDFGRPAASEDQVAELVNFQPTQKTYQLTLMDTVFSFVGCTNPCTRTMAPDQHDQVVIRCTPGIGGLHTTIMQMTEFNGSNSMMVASSTLSCDAGTASGTIQVDPDSIPINNPPGLGSAHVTAVPMPTSEMLKSATLMPTGIVEFQGTGCTQYACNFPAGQALPHDLALHCLTNSAAVLTVVGNTTQATATVQCIDSSMNGPLITVPQTVFSPDTAVGMSSTTGFTISNPGGQPLEVQPIAVPAPWTGISGCINGCSVGSGGSASVMLGFSPPSWQPDPIIDSFTINSNAGNTPMANVGLQGRGTGAELEIENPVVDFGRIARGPSIDKPLTVHPTGNTSLDVGLAGLTGALSSDPPAMTLSPNVAGVFTISCGSPNATGPITQVVTLTTTAYATTPSPPDVTVKCEVLPTDVGVTPPGFPFDEVRIGTAAVEMPFTIKNNGTSSADVTAVRLAGSSPVIGLEHDSIGTLPAGGTIAGTITLSPTEEATVELALEVDVDGLTLSYPITAKVVTPHAYVTPSTLDLGTVCIGTQAAGEVTITNDGTATLDMRTPPTMDMAFVPRYTTPSGYPYMLRKDEEAKVEIRPATMTTGKLEGTLTWEVDAAIAPFTVPVTLETIAEGTAVSPGKVELGSWDVGTRSPDRVVRLENCSMQPVEIFLRGVVPNRGPIAAWDLRPKTDQRVLGPHDTMTITVAFEPKEPGTYLAAISFEVDGQQHQVPLAAEAVGRALDKTSFYACGCDGNAPPSRGLTVVIPILLALALALRRRAC